MQLWIANPDGSEPRKLLDMKGDTSGNLIWSPDGQQLAFSNVAGPNGESELWLTDLAGNAHSLATWPHWGIFPIAWRPAAAPIAGPSQSPATPSAATVVSDLSLEGSSNGLAAIDGTAWVSTLKTFVRVDAGSTPAVLPMQQSPESLVAAPDGSVWLGGFEPGKGAYLARISGSEVAPDVVLPLPVDMHVSLLAASKTAVWAIVQPTSALSVGTLYRVDLTSGTVTDRVALSDVTPANLHNTATVFDMSADESSLYLAVADYNPSLGTATNYRFLRIDVATGITTASVTMNTTHVIVAYGSVWGAGEKSPIRLGADLTRPQQLDVPANAYPFGDGSGQVWFIDGSARTTRLVAVNAADNAIAVDVSVPRQSGWGSVEAVYDGAGHVWLLYENGEVQEIAPTPLLPSG